MEPAKRIHFVKRSDPTESTIPNKTRQTRIPYLLLLPLAILTPLFFLGGPHYYSPHYLKKIWNLGHILYFSLFALFVRHYTQKQAMRFYILALLILGLTFFIGIPIELIQANFHRTPDIGDLFRNLIGAMVGISFLLPERKTLPKPFDLSLKTITIALVLLQLYPIVTACTDAYLANSRFPILSDLETPFELERWATNTDIRITDAIRHSGRHSLKIELKTTLYSGVVLEEFKKNWESYRWFQFSAYNPSARPITITCRINDRRHVIGPQNYNDRFNRRYTLPQGWSTILIDLKDVRNAPSQRQMDMRHIKGIGFYATKLKKPHILYIDDVKLSNGPEQAPSRHKP